MPTLTVNGTALSYRESGAGDAVVLLHGFPLDRRLWEAQVAPLAKQWRVITPDLRGFGESSAAGDPFTIASLADDVQALLAKIGALPCALGGLSMGGYVALAYVRQHGESLRALMLLDTKAEADTLQAREGRAKMIEKVRSGGAKAVADEMLPKMFSPGAESRHPQMAAALRVIMEACPPATIEAALVAMRDRPDYSPVLQTLSIPTLVVVGDADVITPPQVAEAMHKQIRRSTLSLIHNAGHASPMEQPEQVTDALRRFLDGL